MNDSTRNSLKDSASSAAEHLDVYDENVAVPEVRTGKVNVDDDFHKGQDIENVKHEHHVSFDTVAVPEYHTGKCPPWDPECNKQGSKDNETKHHNFLSDLARTLMNGTSEK